MNEYLNSPVSSLKGIGEKTQNVFSGRGIVSIYDILTLFPQFYIDKETKAEKIAPGVSSVYEVEIKKISIYRRYARRFSVINIIGECCNNPINIRIFNKPYIYDGLQSGSKISVFGLAIQKEDIFIMDNPLILDKKKGGIIPIYKRVSSIGSGRIKKFIESAFQDEGKILEFLPDVIRSKRGFPKLKESLTKIHFPVKSDMKSMEKLKKRFKYTEFFLFHLELNYIRKKISKKPRKNFYTKKINPEKIPGDLIDFSLTVDQRKAIKNIYNDMYGGNSMQRLLMGEVGSGKTIVAFSYLLIALMNGFQGAMLAPTGILALQHYEKGVEFFADFRLALLTGNTIPRERNKILEKLANGEIDLIFGTHSLIYDKVVFRKLSAIVIDEQHRFGVSQRAALFYKGKNVDLLVSTATPIPRTLLLSIYKDLSISLIRTLPSERKPVKTLVVEPSKREDFYLNLRERIKKGEKGYIVIPLIESSENFSGLRSLESELPFFKGLFKEIPMGILSGRTSEEEKNMTIQKFKNGEIHVLISTTVIEVGIDVREAIFIVIEDADRFGLSQLHQLRGRVGRGELQSYCYLFPRKKITESGKQRIKALREFTDGFRIAEMDMKIRGPGLIHGFRQSGRLDFRLGDPKTDFELFKMAEKDAVALIENTGLMNDFVKNIIIEADEKLKSLNFS